MAETNSNASGAVPPKPPEAAKVQPKKETVRINLPPKPAAVPSIKIPAPPPAGGAGRVPSAPAAAPATAPPAAPAASAAAVPSGAALRTSGGAPAAAPRAAAAPRPLAPAISGLDKGLAIAAVVLSVAVLVRLVFVMMAP
jgi:hypothetical protein